MTGLLEICVDSTESAFAAQQGGADRLEVCSALAIGGTTPSTAFLDYCVQTLGMPSMMMIRPHDGGFVYSNDDVKIMLANIMIAQQVGAHGIVFGALTVDRNIDVEICQRLIDAAGELEITFHRAIDMTPDPLATAKKLESMGFHRILTSGQKTTAIAGADTIRAIQQSCPAMSIIAGSGVNEANVVDLMALTGVREIHASASVKLKGLESPTDVSFGEQQRVTSKEIVRQIKSKMDHQFQQQFRDQAS